MAQHEVLSGLPFLLILSCPDLKSVYVVGPRHSLRRSNQDVISAAHALCHSVVLRFCFPGDLGLVFATYPRHVGAHCEVAEAKRSGTNSSSLPLLAFLVFRAAHVVVLYVVLTASRLDVGAQLQRSVQ